MLAAGKERPVLVTTAHRGVFPPGEPIVKLPFGISANFMPMLPESGWGILAYPADPDLPGVPPAETRNPWRLKGGQRVCFMALPHDIEGVAKKLSSVSVN